MSSSQRTFFKCALSLVQYTHWLKVYNQKKETESNSVVPSELVFSDATTIKVSRYQGIKVSRMVVVSTDCAR
jgi:hypothetical protein